jgi:type II secretory pathway pseudopilin PulG
MRRRTGFTIVELLVAMALIIFIMAILSEAFAAGFAAFRNLKALGDMNERLRTATQSLRKYLQADHFEGRKRLSDPNFWNGGPPREGFFKIIQGSPSTYEGITNNVPSYSATTHGLHFTTKFRGNSRGDFFPASFATYPSAAAPNPNALLSVLPAIDGYRDLGATYHAQWIECAIFLLPTDLAVSESGTTPGQLYALYLRTKALIPQPPQPSDVGPITPVTVLGTLADFSIYNTGTVGYANTPADIGIPVRRMSWPPPTLGQEDPTRDGSDVLLTDVLSCNIRVLVVGANDFADLTDLNAIYPQNAALYGTSPQIFDTFTQATQLSLGLPDYGSPTSAQYWPTQIPRYASGTTPIRIKAIQISLRIWDVKTEQTRQATLIVDL